MDKHFRLLGTRKRLTELLISESGAVDIQKTVGLGVVVTGSMLAAMLFAPTNANAAWFACGGQGTNCIVDLQKCCSGWCSIHTQYEYWCCGLQPLPGQPCGVPHDTCHS